MTGTKTTNVGRYLIQRLEEMGVKHVFGVPGDYVLAFDDQMVSSSLQFINTCTEAGAAFAADGYARVNGLGVVCVTYCVGGLNALNGIAGAYAEKSPVIVISGAPGMGERALSPLLHHRVRDFNTQHLIFEQVTVAAEALEDPSQAPRQIDEAIGACLRHKRPVYLELPRDMTTKPCPMPGPLQRPTFTSDPQALAEVVEEAASLLRQAERPVILAGVEIHRFGLQSALLRLVEASGLPVAATLLGKSVITERHHSYLGVYEGAMGREHVRRAVDGSDCVLILGAFMTDINLGIYTAKLDMARSIYATSEGVKIKHHHYADVQLGDFMDALTKADLGRHAQPHLPSNGHGEPMHPTRGRAMTVRRFFARINDFLQDDHVVIADIGDSLFGAVDLTIHRRTEFLSPAYYASMGFAVPAALGAQINKPHLRPIVFVGDGAFQMTGQELSTIARYKLNPIVFVLNNKGYTTERFIQDGPYNDIHDWKYHLFADLLGTGWGCEVHTEDELETALQKAGANTESFSIVNVHLDPMDHSEALARLGRRLSKKTGREVGPSPMKTPPQRELAAAHGT